MRSSLYFLYFFWRSCFSFIDSAYNVCVWALNGVRRAGPSKVVGRLYIKNAGTFSVGCGLKVNSSMWANPIGGDTRTFIVVLKNATLRIGDNVGISNATIYCAEKIVIGDNVLIGGGCRIYDTDFHPVDYAERVVDKKKGCRASVHIAEGVWLCAGVVILKGVHVGARSVIAAGSVVTRDVPADELWGGAPARFIKKINTSRS